MRTCTWNLVFVKVSKVNWLCAHLRGYTPRRGEGGAVKEDRGRRRRGSRLGTLFLFLRGTSAHLPAIPPSSCPLASPVPLNKLVRFNDSYFFLVTRLPSFAPTRRLRKVAVNLVPSFAPSLSLSISATRDHRDSGLTTVRLSPSSSQRCSERRPRYQRMQSSPIQ